MVAEARRNVATEKAAARADVSFIDLEAALGEARDAAQDRQRPATEQTPDGDAAGGRGRCRWRVREQKIVSMTGRLPTPILAELLACPSPAAGPIHAAMDCRSARVDGEGHLQHRFSPVL